MTRRIERLLHLEQIRGSDEAVRSTCETGMYIARSYDGTRNWFSNMQRKR